jgi:hypothetical protein
MYQALLLGRLTESVALSAGDRPILWNARCLRWSRAPVRTERTHSFGNSRILPKNSLLNSLLNSLFLKKLLCNCANLMQFCIDFPIRGPGRHSWFADQKMRPPMKSGLLFIIQIYRYTDIHLRISMHLLHILTDMNLKHDKCCLYVNNALHTII